MKKPITLTAKQTSDKALETGQYVGITDKMFRVGKPFMRDGEEIFPLIPTNVFTPSTTKTHDGA